MTVQSIDYILKLFYQECFLGNLPLRLLKSSCPQLYIFWTFLQKIPVVESFFWSNYRLANQNSDYILKWLHQECFLGNLPKDFGVPKYHRSQIFEVNLFLVTKVTSCDAKHFLTWSKSFLELYFFQFPGNFLGYNNLISMKKKVFQQKSYVTAMQSNICQF